MGIGEAFVAVVRLFVPLGVVSVDEIRRVAFATRLSANLFVCDSGTGERSEDSFDTIEASDRFRFRIDPVEFAAKGVMNTVVSCRIACACGVDKLVFVTTSVCLGFWFTVSGRLEGVSSIKFERLPGVSSINAGRLEMSSIAESVNGGDGGDCCNTNERGN